MKTLHKTEDLQEIIARLDKFSIESPRQWGTMNAQQMLCHVTDQIRCALGEKTSKTSKWKAFFKASLWFILRFPMPKNVMTAPSFDQNKGGTKPTEFENDRQILKTYIQKFVTYQGEYYIHPLFGQISREEWSSLAYAHLDHHFRQFGG